MAMLRCPGGHEGEAVADNEVPGPHETARPGGADTAGEAPLPTAALRRSGTHQPCAKETSPPPLPTPADGWATVAPEPGAPADAHLIRIPGYEIVGELGRGGMGVVYKARHVRLGRLVALKMMLAGPGAGPDERRRFQREAEAMARLQHPNVVQVHEVGEAEGAPFCALEFVSGGSLHERLLRQPITAAAAAGLLEVLARAVQHAHERGIVHRDLKPGNVLLADDGTPKLTDFGLARRFDLDADQTRTGAILGTPNYMAPEQAQGHGHRVGPAADVFALGAILYDMLTGRPPFRGETALDTLQQVVGDDPIPPTRLNVRVPRDLETVCLRCLVKEPAKRYAGAGELADDLRRFLDGTPIRARRVGRAERAVKWARRRPAAAALAAFVALTAAGLVAAGAWYARHEARRAEEAERLHQAARVAERRAADNFRRARAAVEEMLTRVAREKLAHVPQMERVRRELLEKALHFYEDFAAKEAGPDSETRHDTARAFVRAGDIRALLGDQTAAEKAYRTGIALLSALAEAFPDESTYREDLAAACNNLGNVLNDLGRAAESEEAFRRAADLREPLSAVSPDQRRELAVCLINLGALRQKQGRLAEAERDQRRALEQLGGPEPATVRERARALDHLGRLLAEMGRVPEAERAAQDACAALGQMVERWPDAPEYRQELAAAQARLGDLRRDADPAGAEKAYDEALRLRVALAADFPAVPLYRQELAAAHDGRAVLLQSTGRARDADLAQRQALAAREKLATDHPQVPAYRADLAGGYNNRGIFLQTHSRPADAEQAYRKAAALLAALADEQPELPAHRREQARVRLNLAALLFAGGRARQAEDECRQALSLLGRLVADFADVPEYRQEQGRGRHTLGVLLEAQNRLAEAEEAYAQAADDFARLAEEFPKVVDYRQQLAEARLALGLVRRAAGQAERGEESCRAALDVFARLAEECPAVSGHGRALARCHGELAILLAGRGRTEEAEAEFRAAAALQARLVERWPANTEARAEEIRTWQNLGALYETLGRADERDEARRRVARLKAKQ